MSPLVICLLLVLASAVLLLPRRPAALTMLAGVLYLTQSEGIVLGGFTLHTVRLFTYAAALRTFIKHEYRDRDPHPIDRSIIILYGFSTTVFLLRSDENIAAVAAKSLDAVMFYVAARGMVRGRDDVRWLLHKLIFLLIPYVAMLGMEYLTSINPFALLGADKSGWTRGDRIRCFGSFRHPSLLGSVGAVLFPLYFALVHNHAHRRTAYAGVALSALIVIASSSGGPLSAFAAGCAAWLAWPLRNNMRAVRRSLVVGVLAMALLMKAPIWYLIARVSSITGGTGYHRAYLLDVAFSHLDEWWLIGMPIEDTAGWFPYVLQSTGGADMTNQYLSFGITAGLAALGLSVWLFAVAFRGVGIALHSARSSTPGLAGDGALLWGMGATLLVHSVNWLGINYFDQFNLLWMWQLAAIASSTTAAANSASESSADAASEFAGSPMRATSLP